MLPGQTCGWTIPEHCAQLFQGYRAIGGILLADPDSHGRKPSACTWHEDELRIANNGDEPWKRLCSNMSLPLMMMMRQVRCETLLATILF